MPEAAVLADWHHSMMTSSARFRSSWRTFDPLASEWAKGVARVIKYLKEIDVSGRA